MGQIKMNKEISDKWNSQPVNMLTDDNSSFCLQYTRGLSHLRELDCCLLLSVSSTLIRHPCNVFPLNQSTAFFTLTLLANPTNLCCQFTPKYVTSVFTCDQTFDCSSNLWWWPTKILLLQCPEIPASGSSLWNGHGFTWNTRRKTDSLKNWNYNCYRYYYCYYCTVATITFSYFRLFV